MAITLGKDATVSVGGSITGVRNVTFSRNARTIEIEEYASRFVSVYQTGYDASVSMEANDDQSLSAIYTAMTNGTSVTVTGSPGSWSFPAVITSITQNASVDGVVTWQIEARMTKEGLR